mmetsp:Transcript_29337/g.39858  ORF Transcript_29337/g.39858 Transcript_29337/m.39858 type:complete len:538 (-) Transcript_29337:238-1851(-)|eukprot:CAMPEP_0185744988 /NCGR_PEP_ID=MMETSP1174-20130828/3272_1 /TAXON_ID=35687 /ORGANISM="Dictyocha speculum, Strain CCMP1381" /LENGTH=537 /DNA_ID=CAMNT_0028418751 /DNA_START=50 /DNA_END=1663 /DNA_ORIENTATION=+
MLPIHLAPMKSWGGINGCMAAVVRIASLVSLLSCAHGCVTDYDSSTDYFPTKMKITTASTFNITYFPAYKVIEVDGREGSYGVQKIVAYMCGTPKPDVTGANLTVEVPLSNVAFTATTMIPFFEVIGERESIAAMLTDPSYVSSPCVNQMYDDGDIVIGGSFSSWPYSVNKTILVKKSVEVAFSDGSYISSLDTMGALMMGRYENTNLGYVEYLKYFAAFYNKESLGNELYATVADRYECIEENSDAIDVGKGKNILWCSWAGEWETTWYDAEGGTENLWSCGTCPNYYCEYASALNATLLDYTKHATSVTTTSDGYYIDNDTFEELLEQADVWIYTGQDFSSALAARGDLLDESSVVKNMKVFHVNNKGSDDWFESRGVEPDVVLEDLLVALSDDETYVNHEPQWISHVYLDANELADTSTLNRGTCLNVSASHELVADSCDTLLINIDNDDNADDDDDDDEDLEKKLKASVMLTIIGGVLLGLMCLMTCFMCVRMKQEKVPIIAVYSPLSDGKETEKVHSEGDVEVTTIQDSSTP